MDELSELRRDLNELSTSLAVHDQKMEGTLHQISNTQDRIAAAMDKIGDAMLRQSKEKSNGGLVIDPKIIIQLVVGILLAAIAMGGGSEGVKALLGHLIKQ